MLLPTRNLVFPATDGVSFKDLTPKFGAVYDLTGNGKTARQGEPEQVRAGPELRRRDLRIRADAHQPRRQRHHALVETDAATRDYVPDCDLALPGANGECGAMANQNFGRATGGNVYDPAILEGLGRARLQLGVLGRGAA